MEWLWYLWDADILNIYMVQSINVFFYCNGLRVRLREAFFPCLKIINSFSVISSNVLFLSCNHLEVIFVQRVR